MIEQFYFTDSPIGLEKNTAGVQIRATSPGLSDTKNVRVATLKKICVYELPKGILPHSASPASSPVCLTWMTVGQDRVLAQKVYAGLDPQNRPGNYFVHLLAGLPEKWTAKDAINYWRAPFWKRNAEHLAPTELELPTIASPDEIEKGTLTPSNLTDSSVRNYLAMTIQAYLSLKANERLFIAAPSNHVATLIWGLTRALPDFLLRDLTFSTYEREPENAKDLKVIGTCWEGKLYDLPAACYQGFGIGINCYTGKYSPVLNSPTGFAREYAQFAAHNLSNPGGFAKIQAFIEAVNDSGISDIEGFKLFFKFETQDEKTLLTRDEATKLITTKGLARLYLSHQGVMDSLIRWTLEKPEWWNTVAKPRFGTLHYWAQSDPILKNGLELLAQRTIATIHASLGQNAGSKQSADCSNLLQSLAAFAMTPQGNAETAFKKLLEKFTKDLGAEPWKYKRLDVRMWVLQQGRWILPTIEEAIRALDPWLEIAWEDLTAFLQLNVDDAFKFRAVSKCIQRERSLDPRPQAVTKMVQENWAIFEGVLQRLVHGLSQERSAARNFFAELGRQGYSRKVELLNELLNADPSDSLFVDDLLYQANLQTWQEVQKLISARGVQFLYDRWTRIGKYLLETYLVGLDNEAQKSGFYSDKMQAVNSLLAVEPSDLAFTMFVIKTANLSTAKEISQLSEDWRFKVLYDCWKDAARRQVLQEYLGQPLQPKVDVIKKLFAVAPTDEPFKDFVLDKADLKFQDIQSLLETYGPQLLYSRWNRPVGQKMLEIYVNGLKTASFYSKKIESLSQLLDKAPNDQIKDAIIKKVELQDRREIETLIERQGIQFLYSIEQHPARRKLLETYLRNLAWSTVEQKTTCNLLQEMRQHQREINLSSLRHYLVLYMDIPKLEVFVRDLTNLFGEMRDVPPEDKENIEQKLQEIAPTLKSHGQRLVQLAEKSESRQTVPSVTVQTIPTTPPSATTQPPPVTRLPQTPVTNIPERDWWPNLSNKLVWIAGVSVISIILCLCALVVYCKGQACSLPFIPTKTEIPSSPTRLPPGGTTKAPAEAPTQSPIQVPPLMPPTPTLLPTPTPSSTPTPSQTWTLTSTRTPTATPIRFPQPKQLVSSSDNTNNWSDPKVVYPNACGLGTCWNLSTMMPGAKSSVKGLYISEYNQEFPKLESYEVEMAWLVGGSQPEPNETHGYGVTFTTVDGAKWILQIATKENAVHFAFLEYSNIPDPISWVLCDCGTGSLWNRHKFLVKYQKDGNATVAINGKLLSHGTGTTPRQGSNALKVGLVVFGKSSRAQIFSAHVTSEP